MEVVEGQSEGERGVMACPGSGMCGCGDAGVSGGGGHGAGSGGDAGVGGRYPRSSWPGCGGDGWGVGRGERAAHYPYVHHHPHHGMCFL